MKKTSILVFAACILLITSCKKEKSFTPDIASTEQESEVENENINSQKTIDYRDKFVGTYNGVSSTTTTAYGASIPGTAFKFVVSKVPFVANKVKINVSINGSLVNTFTATANSTHLSFSASIIGNMSQTIKMWKTSNSAAPTHFIYSSGGGFTGLISRYVVLNPTKS